MKNFKVLFMALGLVFFVGANLTAQSATTASVEKYTENPDDDIVDIALSSPDHTTLVAALKAADLVSALQGDGPFTVFAPTNGAFDALPEGTVATLLKPENKKALANVLTYHVVVGNLDAGKVVNAIKSSSNGTAKLTALNGGTIKAFIGDGEVYLKDENGNLSKVVATDLKGSNGVIHVIEAVILPKK